MLIESLYRSFCSDFYDSINLLFCFLKLFLISIYLFLDYKTENRKKTIDTVKARRLVDVMYKLTMRQSTIQQNH